MNRILHERHMRGGRRSADIKAPDGFTLGGLRRVRKDATILFSRSWWKVPEEWIGQDVWVHVADCYGIDIDVAPPGLHIHEALHTHRDRVFRPERTARPDARPVFRDPHHKAWAARSANK